MKKSNLARRGHQDPGQLSAQPDKVGWIRKFYGRGIFREIWKNRFVILRGDHLYISEKEVKDERRAVEVCDLLDFERSEELRKLRSRSKKNHSRFTLLRQQETRDTVSSLVFLAVSPEEKESWVNALNIAIVKAKNRVLDEVTVAEDSVLVHPTRDRARVPLGRRQPTRGHLLAVASTSSSSSGSLTLDLVHQWDDSAPEGGEGEELPLWGGGGRCYGDGGGGNRGRQRAGTDVSKLRAGAREGGAGPTTGGSLPRASELSWARRHQGGARLLPPPQPQDQSQTPQPGKDQSRTPQPGKRPSGQGRSRCASMDGVLAPGRPLRSGAEEEEKKEKEEEEKEEGKEEEEAPQAPPVGQLQSLIAQKMQRAQELLEELRLQELQRAAKGGGGGGVAGGNGYDGPAHHHHRKGVDSPRLHHLRGSELPRSPRSPGSGSSSSPRPRGRDSPRVRRKDSPRATPKATPKRSRSKGCDSPAPPSRPGDPDSASPGRAGGPAPPRSPRAAAGEEDSESPPRRRGNLPSRLAGANVDSPVRRGAGASPGAAAAAKPRDTSGDSSPERSDWLVPKASEPCGEEEEGEEEGEESGRRGEAERLLKEAVSSWKEAQDVLEEVRELQSQTLRRQRSSPSSPEDTPTSPSHDQGEAGEGEGEELP